MATFKRGAFYHFEFQFGLERHRGTTKQRTKKAADKVEARERERVEHESAGIAVPRAEDSLPFQEWADYYRAHARRTMGRPERVDDLLRVVMRFWGRKPSDPKLQPRKGEDAPFHDLRLLDPIIEPAWLTRFEDWMVKRGSANQTKNQYRSVISQMYAFAMRPEYRKKLGIQTNPMDGVPRERGGRSIATFTPEQVRSILAAASYHVALAVVIGALAWKLRRTNILRLEWDKHIDANLQYITVYQHKTASTTHKPLVVPISSQLRRVLQDARKRHPKSPYVITYRRDSRGRYKPLKDIRTGLKAAMKQGGVPYGRFTGGTFHTLRHTANTMLAEMEVDPRKQQQAAGHENLSTTMWYTHLRPTVEAPIYEMLSSALPLADIATLPGLRATRKPATNGVGESVGTSARHRRGSPMNTAYLEDPGDRRETAVTS